jgi:hypothetical protein
MDGRVAGRYEWNQRMTSVVCFQHVKKNVFGKIRIPLFFLSFFGDPYYDVTFLCMRRAAACTCLAIVPLR